jgi:hypothetical protein
MAPDTYSRSLEKGLNTKSRQIAKLQHAKNFWFRVGMLGWVLYLTDPYLIDFIRTLG